MRPSAMTRLLSQMFLDDVDDLLRPGADLVLVLALRASRAAAARCLSSGRAAGPGRRRALRRARWRRRRRARSSDRPSRARARSAAPADSVVEIGGQIGERPAGQRDRPQHVQRGAQAVAGEQVVGEDDVARLLAAERQRRAPASPPSRTCRRPRMRTRSMPERAQRELEADVAHHRRDDRVALQPAFALQLTRAHQQHGVAVDDRARDGRRRSRDRRRRRTPRPSAQPRSTTVCASRSGCVDPQSQVDVAAVRLVRR